MFPDRMMKGYIDKVSAVVKTSVDESGEKRSQKYFDVTLSCSDITYPEINDLSEFIHMMITPDDDEQIKFKSVDYGNMIPIFVKNSSLDIKLRHDENINLFDENLEEPLEEIIEKFPMPILSSLHLTMIDDVPQFDIKLLVPNIKSGDFLFNNIKSFIEFQFSPIPVATEEEKSPRTRGKRK